MTLYDFLNPILLQTESGPALRAYYFRLHDIPAFNGLKGLYFIEVIISFVICKGCCMVYIPEFYCMRNMQ